MYPSYPSPFGIPQQTGYPPQGTPAPQLPPQQMQYAGYPAQGPAPPPRDYAQQQVPSQQQQQQQQQQRQYGDMLDEGQPFGSPTASESLFSDTVGGHATVVAAAHFSAENDVRTLHRAMQGFTTDHNAIIDIIGARSSEQLECITLHYKQQLGHDLEHDLEKKLSGEFRQLVKARVMPPSTLGAWMCHQTMEGLIEVLASRTNLQILGLRVAYNELYKHNHKDSHIEDHIVNEPFSDHLKNLLVALSEGERDESQIVNQQLATEDAIALSEAAETHRPGKSDFNLLLNRILALRSYSQLRATFAALSSTGRNNTIEQLIERNISGDIRESILAVGTSPFAQRAA